MPRQTVLEVVRYDQESGMWIIASGFGNKSDWVLNIQADPSMTV
jgi:deazaflavin-dependent oxidoreductase (nitroreductase family)